MSGVEPRFWSQKGSDSLTVVGDYIAHGIAHGQQNHKRRGFAVLRPQRDVCMSLGLSSRADIGVTVKQSCARTRHHSTVLHWRSIRARQRERQLHALDGSRPRVSRPPFTPSLEPTHSLRSAAACSCRRRSWRRSWGSAPARRADRPPPCPSPGAAGSDSSACVRLEPHDRMVCAGVRVQRPDRRRAPPAVQRRHTADTELRSRVAGNSRCAGSLSSMNVVTGSLPTVHERKQRGRRTLCDSGPAHSGHWGQGQPQDQGGSRS